MAGMKQVFFSIIITNFNSKAQREIKDKYIYKFILYLSEDEVNQIM